MNTRIQQGLARFTNNTTLDKFRILMAQLRSAQKPARSTTYKPAFSMGFRGAARTMTPPGRITAPTIDQVRKLEQTYMCKLKVWQGMIYFRDGTPFTHERGKNYRHEVMQEMVAEI